MTFSSSLRAGEEKTGPWVFRSHTDSPVTPFKAKTLDVASAIEPTKTTRPPSCRAGEDQIFVEREGKNAFQFTHMQKEK